MSSKGRLSAALLALPLAAATLAMLGTAVVDRAGGGDDRRPANSAEAAAMDNVAELLRYVGSGENPTRIRAVRPHIISSSVPWATTLEAALWARSPELIRLLDEQGYIVGDDMRHELACLAADLDLPEVTQYLGGAAATSCVPQAALQRVVARASGGEQ
jgi:hypothetical protein